MKSRGHEHGVVLGIAFIVLSAQLILAASSPPPPPPPVTLPPPVNGFITISVNAGYDSDSDLDPDCWVFPNSYGISSCTVTPQTTGALNPRNQQNCAAAVVAHYNTLNLAGFAGGWTLQSWTASGGSGACGTTAPSASPNAYNSNTNDPTSQLLIVTLTRPATTGACTPSCSSGQVCQNGSCVPSTACTSNANCASGQICQNGQCVTASCTSNSQCSSGQICVSGQCTTISDLDTNEAACESQGFDWENFTTSSNKCCGDDNFQDMGTSGAGTSWLCFNQGGIATPPTVTGGAWEWMRALNNEGGLVDNEPTNTTYIASGSIWRSCPLNPSPYLAAGSDYLCFDPNLIYANGPFDRRLLMRIDYFSCGPYGNNGPTCGQQPYITYNGDNLLHLFSRSKQWLGSFPSTGSNNYAIPLATQNAVPVHAGEVLEYYGETFSNIPGESGSAAISLIYQRSSGQQTTLSYAAQNTGTTFTFPEDGTLIFPTGSTNVYGAHVAVFLNVDEPPSVLNSNQEKSIAACCGNNIAGCSSLINGQLRGGIRKSTGQSIDAGSQRYYCSPTGRWLTDLDALASQGDPLGSACDFARYPNGADPDFGWTGSQCCGDDGNETYNDPGNLRGACFQGDIHAHCSSPFGNNTGLVQNGVINSCDSNAFCSRGCNLTYVCTTNTGWASSSAANYYNLSMIPPSALGYLLIAYTGLCDPSFPQAAPVCLSTPVSNVFRMYGRNGQVLATVQPFLPSQYQLANPLSVPIMAGDQLFFTASSGTLTFKYRNLQGVLLNTFVLNPSSSNPTAPVATLSQNGFIEFEAGVVESGVSMLVIKTNAQVPSSQQFCCQNGACFNGNTCLPNQAQSVNAPPSGGNYRCINGGWSLASDHRTPTGMLGYCDAPQKCLYSELTGGVTASVNNTVTQGVSCVNDGSFVGKDRCVAGRWSSRTSLLLEMMLRGVSSGQDFVAYCDSPSAILNNLNTVIPSTGSPLSAIFAGLANDVCLVKTPNYFFFGTSLNSPIGENGLILSAFGVSQDACDNVGVASGNIPGQCTGSQYAFYDPATALFVFALPRQSGLPAPSLSNVVSGQSITQMWVSLVWANIFSYPTNFDFSGSLDIFRYDRVFAARKGSKFVAGVIENPFYGTIDYLRIHYNGFGATDLCNYVDIINTKQQTAGFPPGYHVMYCDSSTVVISRDLVNVPTLGVDWQADTVWQPLSSMLRDVTP